MSDKPDNTLTTREKSAMRWFKDNLLTGYCTGTRRIVTMQKLADKGFVKPIYHRGMLADWQITQAGKDWNE